MLEEIKQIRDKMQQTLEGVHAAQKANDELKSQFGGRIEGMDSTVKKAAEDSAKALADAQELKLKLESVEKTGQYIEKALSRMNGVGDNQSKELEHKAREETIRYLRDRTPMSSDVVNATAKAIVDSGLHGVSESVRDNEIKSLIAGSNPDGGYFIRPERSAKMITRIFETSPIRSIADVQTTNSDSIEFIVDDNEAASGGWVGETDPRAITNTPQIGKLTIVAHEQFAQPRATQKMLDDAGFDIEAWLANKVTSRMSRVENTAFVVGDGAQKPRGFLALPSWSSPGVYQRGALERINSGVNGQFSADAFKRMQASLKEDYQRSAVWGLKRASWADVTTLKDGQGQYLLDPRSMKDGDSLILLGKRVIFMEDMPAIGVGTQSAVYGDFSVGYTVVDRIGFRVLRDAFTAKPYVLFYTTKRTGGDVTNYEAIKVMVLSAA